MSRIKGEDRNSLLKVLRDAIGVVEGKNRSMEKTPKWQTWEAQEAQFDEYLFEIFDLLCAASEELEDCKIPKAPKNLVKKKSPEKRTKTLLPPRWIAADEEVQIKDIRIPGGMFYLGSRKTNQKHSISMIDPDLPLKKEELRPFTPLYHYQSGLIEALSPRDRYWYLMWLSRGRSNPEVPIDWVMYYFYGLEYRVIEDLKMDLKHRTELEAILSEIKRLLSIYGKYYFFNSNASKLVEYMKCCIVEPYRYLRPPDIISESGRTLPHLFYITLGQIAAAKVPLPVSWALEWALKDELILKRVAVTRCKEVFSKAFCLLYQKKYGEGFKLPIAKKNIEIKYYPVSIKPRNFVSQSHKSLPDLSKVRIPRNKLNELVNDATNLIEAYSRFMVRNPELEYSIQGLIHLPFELWPENAQLMWRTLLAELSKGFLKLSYADLLKRLCSNEPEPESKKTYEKLVILLSSLKIRLEPDYLAAGQFPSPDERVALYFWDLGSPKSQEAFAHARILIELACSVLAVDGEVNQAEWKALEAQMDSWTCFDANQQDFLKLKAQLQSKYPATFSNFKKKLSEVTACNPSELVRFFAHLTCADGEPQYAEIRFLEKVYTALELDKKLLLNDLHCSFFSGFSLFSKGDWQPTPRASNLNLDLERVKALQLETAAVSSLLGWVFSEQGAEPQAPAERLLVAAPAHASEAGHPDQAPIFLMLDELHAKFLKRLLEREQWRRAELLEIATEFGLMLDGALEQINDAAFEHYDQALFEGDDPIQLQIELQEFFAK